ncbi:hypothetical protein JCM6882_006136 [Rhodosporidiobolus microsporus]
MRLAWVTPSPSTLSRSLRLYSSKLCLFYLLWSYSPTFPSVPPPSSPHTAANGTTTSLGVARQGGNEAGTLEGRAGVPAGVTLNAQGVGQDDDEGAEAGESPLTPPFDVSSSSSVPPPGETAMPAKGSTSRRAASDGPALFHGGGHQETPPLSPAPAPEASSSSASPSFSPSPAPPAPPVDNSPDPAKGWTLTLTPLPHTLLLLHLLLLIHALALSLSDALSVRLLLRSPSLSSTFSPSPYRRAKPASAPTCASKRWTRLKWQFSELLRAAGPPGVLVALLLVGLVGVVAGSFFLPSLTHKHSHALEGWNAVPLSGLFSIAGDAASEGGLRMRVAQGYAATSGAARAFGKVGGPWRWVVACELLSTLSTLLHALTPLALSLRLLPPSLRCPRSLAPPLSPSSPHFPSLLLPTPLLLSHSHALLPPLLSLAQSLVLLLARYAPPTQPAWRRWVGFSTLVLVNAVVSATEAGYEERERVRAEVERVGKVVGAFGERLGKGEGREKEREEEGDWVCTICFEGAKQEEQDHARRTHPGWATYWTRCRLPCSHAFHATCLASWFASQAFCPTCHRAARPPPTAPLPPFNPVLNLDVPLPLPLPLPLNPLPPPPLQNDYDAFPGAAAAARRARRGGGGAGAGTGEDAAGGPRRRNVFSDAGAEGVRGEEEEW